MKSKRLLAVLIALCLLFATSASAAVVERSRVIYMPELFIEEFNNNLERFNSYYFNNAFNGDWVYDYFHLIYLESDDEMTLYSNQDLSMLLIASNNDSMAAFFDINSTYGEHAEAFFALALEDLCSFYNLNAGAFLDWCNADQSRFPTGTYYSEGFVCEVTDMDDLFNDGGWWICFLITPGVQ